MLVVSSPPPEVPYGGAVCVCVYVCVCAVSSAQVAPNETQIAKQKYRKNCNPKEKKIEETNVCSDGSCATKCVKTKSSKIKRMQK